ncbi:MAG TPA: hypothetical protein VJ036_03815 [bacterium]|jgi:hypothetical protein|nr:hypothetical protein [bacterium]
MNQAPIQEIKRNLIQALVIIKETVDLSIPLLKTNQRKMAVALWEAFLREFIAYLRNRSKATGMNLMRYISLTRILFK